jgi:PKD repeat protein
MYTVTSDFATTPIVPADSHGPYVVIGGGPVTLSAGPTHPSATYEWDLGDGATANTHTVTHRYGRAGIYVAKLTVTVNDPGGAITRHFAIVDIRNTPPTVNAGDARTVDEGDVADFTASFTDPQWLDVHTASWDWDDYRPRTDGVVAETHHEPQGTGTVTASHAWGDAGDYVAVLRVRDDQGGIGEAQVNVTVRNVAPRVDAGPAMFAYPCCVITLRGLFIDPGWLDTHVGYWDFGDCSGVQLAVVRETHLPPRGRGEVIASHVYTKCGDYRATCTVYDDDLGRGCSDTLIRVVDVVNRGFEHGFHGDVLGLVANGWFAYGPSDARDDVFAAEELLVHDGQRSQRIRFDGRNSAGIWQHVGANRGWEYQVTVWYSLHPQAGGDSLIISDEEEHVPITGAAARLGIDPKGGHDPQAPQVVWSEGRVRGEWSSLSGRVVARGDVITIFLEGSGDEKLSTDVCFDDVALIAVQPFCPEVPTEPEPPADRKTCVDFSDVPPGEVPASYAKSGFTFNHPNGQSQRIVTWGEPTGGHKLVIQRLLLITLPFTSNHVEVTVSTREKEQVPVGVEGVDAQRHPVAEVIDQGSGERTINLDGAGMTEIAVLARKSETLLIRVCASRQTADGPAAGYVNPGYYVNPAYTGKTYEYIQMKRGSQDTTKGGGSNGR